MTDDNLCEADFRLLVIHKRICSRDAFFNGKESYGRFNGSVVAKGLFAVILSSSSEKRGVLGCVDERSVGGDEELFGSLSRIFGVVAFHV